MPKTIDYVYIRAWGKYMGSKHWYIEDQVQSARESDAPDDAYGQIYAKDGSGWTGEWARVRDLPEHVKHDIDAIISARYS